MNEKFDESSLNEQTINDVETARLALRWALDKIRVLHEDELKSRQNLQEKSSQVTFLENQLKNRNSEMERAMRSHDEEIRSRQDSLEVQFRARLERVSEREKELEDKISKHEELLKQKETKLHDDYQKKSEELRGRWAQVEAELWQLRQEQLAKQQEFERVYGARLEEEKKKAADETAAMKVSMEAAYANKVEELEKRERSASEELKKQEAMLKWARDSWQKDTEERERGLKQKDLDIDRKILEKNQEIEDFKVKVSLLQKQLDALPEAVRRRDEDISRYKDALRSLEGVIGTLETEKKELKDGYEARLNKMETGLEAERTRYREMEVEIPRRLKLAVEHERNRLAEKLQEIDKGYKEDLAKRAEEIAYLERNMRALEETAKSAQTDRETVAAKLEQMQAMHAAKLEEFAFRERQLQTEYDVRLKVEIEKHSRDLRAELETSTRIYEDSLRLKGEEISHLRTELDEVVKDRASAREQVAALRRDLDAQGERNVAEVNGLKIKLRADLEKELAAAAAEAARKYSADKQAVMEMFEEKVSTLSAALERKEQGITQLKLALQKAGEDQKLALAEERARNAAALEEHAATAAATLRLREDKVTELARALEGARLEREELLILERQRLERLYSEKEKGMDSELAAKDSELIRARDTVAKVMADREALVSSFESEKRVTEEKVTAMAARLADAEAASSVKAEAAARREIARYSEMLDHKNADLEAASRLRQAQEENYRKTLEDLREKLSEVLGKFETLKKTADERQVQLSTLQMELAAEKHNAEGASGRIAERLAAREKDYKALRAEYDDFRGAFEEEVKAGEKKYDDVSHRLRAAEEQKAVRDKQIEALKRDGELLRSELVRHDKEDTELKSSFSKKLETERRELRAAAERQSQEFEQKEKAMLAELSVYRDEAAANSIAAEKYRVQAEDASRNEDRLKSALEDERSRKVPPAQVTESDREKELKSLRSTVEQLQDRLCQAEKKVDKL